LAVLHVDVPQRAQRAPLLERVTLAVQQPAWVRIRYQSAERQSTQHIWPRHLSTQAGYWYCHAYSYERRADRTFRVDRIRELGPAGKRFEVVPAPEPTPYLDESHPVVLVRLTARGVAYVESEPHLGQIVQREPGGAGWLSFRCPPGEFDWYARYFAGFGLEAEVCEPSELSRRIRQLGQRLARHYQNR
jgi:predicted DNA-binding transcriptional regulator YafY